MKPYIFLLVVLIIINFNSSAQDTIRENPKKRVDTVVIYKDPVVITKPVIIEEGRPSAAIKYFVDGFISGSYYVMHYGICEPCKDYVIKVRSSTKQLPSFSLGGNFYFIPGRIYLSAGFSYAAFRERFSYSDSSTGNHNITNRYRYLEINFSGGYFLTKKRLYSAVAAGLIAADLFTYQGYTYSLYQPEKLTKVGQEFHRNRYILGMLASFKLMYSVSEKFKLLAEPYYRFDLTSLVQRKGPYTLQRNIYGLKAGLVFMVR